MSASFFLAPQENNAYIRGMEMKDFCRFLRDRRLAGGVTTAALGRVVGECNSLFSYLDRCADGSMNSRRFYAYCELLGLDLMIGPTTDPFSAQGYLKQVRIAHGLTLTACGQGTGYKTQGNVTQIEKCLEHVALRRVLELTTFLRVPVVVCSAPVPSHQALCTDPYVAPFPLTLGPTVR